MALTLKFKARKRKIGNSWMVTVPSGIADILEDKEYEYRISEVRE